MSLFSALTASVSGMAAQANSLTTISENISNASTYGYKDTTTLFQDLVDQIGATGDYNAGGVTTTIRTNVAEQGNLTSTTSTTDLAIQGQGFFVVKNSAGDILLTRSGSFTKDGNGNLVNAAGYTLMAYNLAPGSNGFTGSVAALVPVNISGAKLVATPTTSGTFSANLNSNAAAVTGAPSLTNYTSKSSVLAYDNLGNPVTLDLYFSKTGANSWQVDVYNEASPTAPLVTQTLNFNPADGSLTSPSSLSIAVPNGQTVSLNIAGITQLASSFAVTDATMNGTPPSQWQGVSIGKDGTIDNLYSNGQQIPAYQIPLANVVSPDNLTNVTGNAFSVNGDSGNLLIGTASVGGLGTINSSELETSTVDLATQLTDMIVAQRGYESNSKVFQTGSEMLSTLINTLHS